MGKTSFALSLAKNIAVDAGEAIGFFSLEMNNVQLVNRLISNVCEIVGSKILNGQLTPDEWDRLDKRLRTLQGAKVFIDDTPGLSVFELRTKARRLGREKNVNFQTTRDTYMHVGFYQFHAFRAGGSCENAKFAYFFLIKAS